MCAVFYFLFFLPDNFSYRYQKNFFFWLKKKWKNLICIFLQKIKSWNVLIVYRHCYFCAYAKLNKLMPHKYVNLLNFTSSSTFLYWSTKKLMKHFRLRLCLENNQTTDLLGKTTIILLSLFFHSLLHYIYTHTFFYRKLLSTGFAVHALLIHFVVFSVYRLFWVHTIYFFIKFIEFLWIFDNITFWCYQLMITMQQFSGWVKNFLNRRYGKWKIWFWKYLQ